MLFAAVVVTTAGIIASVVLAWSYSPASARDAESTSDYLIARALQQKVARANYPAMREAAQAFVAGLSRGCPGVLGNAPTNVTRVHGQAVQVIREEPMLEALAALHTVLRQTLRNATRRFVRGVIGLRWHAVKVTSVVHTFAEMEAAVLSSPTPDVCHDISGWAADGYREYRASRTWPDSGTEALNERLANELHGFGKQFRVPGRSVTEVLGRDMANAAEERLIRLEREVGAKEAALLITTTHEIEMTLGL